MKVYKWLRGLMKASALTTVMFIMQACYGSPYSQGIYEIPVSGIVVDKATGEPLQGIRVDACLWEENFSRLSCYTDDNGRFSLSQWANHQEVHPIEIAVIDNFGEYETLDTVVYSDTDILNLKFKLESKE